MTVLFNFAATDFKSLATRKDSCGSGGFAVNNIYNSYSNGQSINGWDVADAGIGTVATVSSGASLAIAAGVLNPATLGAAAFLVSNPVGWGIAVGSAAYFGYRAYESYYGSDD